MGLRNDVAAPRKGYQNDVEKDDAGAVVPHAGWIASATGTQRSEITRGEENARGGADTYGPAALS